MLLERQSVTEAEAHYRVTLYDADTHWTSAARIAKTDGAIALDEFTGDPPAWLVAGARAFLRTVWTGARKDDAYPRRVLRWRAAK